MSQKDYPDLCIASGTSFWNAAGYPIKQEDKDASIDIRFQLCWGGGLLVTCWSSIPQAIELNSRLSALICWQSSLMVKMLMPLTS